MTLKIIRLVNKIAKYENFTIIVLLLFFSFLIRLPYIFWDTISIDENIYIILGDLITKGEKPHQNFWEIKPALVWYLYSIPLFINKSLISVRIFGILIIFLSSFIFYKIIRKILDRGIALISSIFLILSSSFLGSEIPNHSIGQGFNVITQHFCNFFIIISIFFLLSDNKYKNLNFFLSICFFSLAVFTRYNYLLCLPIYLYQSINNKKIFINFLISVLVFVIFFLIIHYDYLFNNRINDLLNYFYFLKIYATSSQNDFHTLISKIVFALNKYVTFIFHPLFFPNILNIKFLQTIFIFFLSIIGVIIFLLKNDKKNYFIIIFLLFYIFLFISLIPGEPAESNLIEILPFACFFSVFTLKNFKSYQIKIIFFIFLFSSIYQIQTEYRYLFSRIIHKQSLMIGPTYEILNFIKNSKVDSSNSFYLNYQLLYFETDNKPIHKLMFPTQYNYWNLIIEKRNRDELYQDIFNKRPNLVLFDDNQWNIKYNPDVYSIIKLNLEKNYKKIYSFKSLILYQIN
jgi:hypothetical protein